MREVCRPAAHASVRTFRDVAADTVARRGRTGRGDAHARRTASGHCPTRLPPRPSASTVSVASPATPLARAAYCLMVIAYR